MIIIEEKVNCPEAVIREAFKESGRMYFDIETTGLNKNRSFIYLLGAMWQEKDGIRIRQYFAAKPSDEKEMLEDFMDLCRGSACMLHFNGDSFDLPYIRHRAAFYGIEDRMPEAGMDLYRRYMPLRKLCPMGNMKLPSLQRMAGYDRRDRCSGKELIKVYENYLENADENLKKSLFLHNFDDVAGLLWLWELEYLLALKKEKLLPDHVTMKRENGAGEDADEICLFCAYREMSLHGSYGSYDFQGIKLDMGLPTEEGEKVEGTLICIHVPVNRDRLYHYFTDYKNYYYLPAEDKAIHKSLAVYVDPEARVKASKENAYVSARGDFLPQFKGLIEPVFKNKSGDKNDLFFRADRAFTEDPDLQKMYAAHIIAAVLNKQ